MPGNKHFQTRLWTSKPCWKVLLIDIDFALIYFIIHTTEPISIPMMSLRLRDCWQWQKYHKLALFEKKKYYQMEVGARGCLTLAWWRHQMKKKSCYWPIVWGIYRQPVDFPHKGQWHRALMLFLIYARANGWANNRDEPVIWDTIALIMTSLGWQSVRDQLIFPWSLHLSLWN